MERLLIMELYPLTKPQLTIRYMEQFFGESIANITGSVIFNEYVNITDLSDAIHKMVMVCDAFRIKIMRQDGVELQYISDFEQFDIAVIKFESNDEFDKWVDKLARTSFNIYGRLFQIYIIEICGKTGLTVHLHHLIADAWTMNLLFNTITKILNGEDVAVHSYSKFIASEKEYNHSVRSVKDKEYFLSCFEKQQEPVFLSDKRTPNIYSK